MIPALDSTFHWNKTPLTFSIPTEGSTWSYDNEASSLNYTVLSTEQSKVFRKIIESWNELISLEIKEVLEPNNIGDIRIALSDVGGAYAYHPSKNDSGGDIWLDYSWRTATFSEISRVSWLLTLSLIHI